jgi:hypothetical protein
MLSTVEISRAKVTDTDDTLLGDKDEFKGEAGLSPVLATLGSMRNISLQPTLFYRSSICGSLSGAISTRKEKGGLKCLASLHLLIVG